MNAPRSISQVEAQARAELVEVVRYDLELDFTGLLEGEAMRATSRISFRCNEAGADTFVDCLAEVEEATLNGRALPTGQLPGGRIPLSDLAEQNELVVRSVQTNTAQAQGVHRTVDPADGEVYVWTTFEPDDARRVFACFDQPDLKAVFGIEAVVPEAWTATSNSGAAEVTGSGATRRWAFADTPALSTYNIVVNAGPFHEIRSERGDHDLGLFCRQSLVPLLERDAEEYFDVTSSGLAFFGEQFGLEFPQRRYDQVFVPDLGGAMENFGCVTWSDAVLFRRTPSYADRELRALVLLHEMAHMWFGDMVTMQWWDDLWLNESFAEWASHWAAVRCTEFTDAWAGQLASDKQLAYAADLAPTTHPIRQPIVDVEAVAASFDAITYPKGASTLKQLVALVGEPVFLAALRRYFTKHAWANTTLHDLILELEHESGRDLDEWVASWLGTAGTDRLVVERSGTEAHIRVEPPQGRGPLLHRLDVGLYVDQGGRLVRDAVRELEVRGDTTLTDIDADTLLLVNDGDLTFASVLPDPVSLDRMLGRGGGFPDPLSRCLAATTAWNLLVRGETDAAGFVRCAVDVLRHETAPSVVEPVLTLARQAADLWSSKADREALQVAVADACLLLVEQPEHRLGAIRTLAGTATTPEQLEALDRLATDTDQRWRRLTRLAELDRFDAEEAERLLAEDPDPDAEKRALAARTAQPDAAVKRAAWDRVFDEVGVGASAVPSVGKSFWRPGQEELLRPFAEEFLQVLPAIGERGMMAGMSLVAAMLPPVGVDEEYLDRLVAAVQPPEIPELVRQRVTEQADTVRRMLRARGGTDA
ncbi:aminopeptidase N [Nocardioides mesophilus]|uniref:Aminopeptidase N n=1 Tax=Nocardioides mesophilus TaxID=433659 RepID=A0A7G9R9U3_9ACTN|nr:aminopeptidase N [Nocardioides mesophilus]QNN52368.1 aminopeptidase N [Nocardioides mesophilus]